jgi:glycine dehydrogenase
MTPTDRPTLRDLEGAAPFATRHIGPSEDEVAKMLAVVGHGSLAELALAAVPEAIRAVEGLDLPPAASEPEAIAELRALADRNTVQVPMIGTGYSGTHTPPVVLRNVLENPAWYTAYTPYQPEISQGRLEALLNFQTVVSDLTGLPIAGASLLDESTAAAEAMTLIRRSTKHASPTFFIDAETHPQTVAVVAARAEPIGIDLVIGTLEELDPSACFGALLQHPGTTGAIRDLAPSIAAVHAAGGLVAVATDLLACAVLVPPGEQGADVVVGSSQRFGVPLGYGGPHAGFLATREDLRRSMPGRLVGVSIDAAGRPAHRLALQTREQHIRREKATSNICTSQALNALAGVVYLVWLGRRGLVELGELLLQRTHYARERLTALDGVEALHAQPIVREFALRLDADVRRVAERCQDQGVNPGYALGRDYPEHPDGLLVAVTEQRSRADIDRLADVLGAAVAAERAEARTEVAA